MDTVENTVAPSRAVVRKRAYTIREFTETFGISRSFAYLEIRAGRLTTKKAGHRTLITEEAAEQWLAGLPAGQEVAA